MSGVWVINRDLFCRTLRLNGISKAETLVFRANTTQRVVTGIFSQTSSRFHSHPLLFSEKQKYFGSGEVLS